MDAGRILLVEDDFAIRQTVADVLEGEGFEVTCAANGEEALRRLGDGGSPPGVILLDLSRVPDIEYSALQMLEEEERRFAGMGITVWLAGLNPGVADFVQSSGLAAQVGKDRLFANVRAAIRRFEAAAAG